MKRAIENIAAYSIDEFISKNNDRIIILDVRSEREYLEGHIRNAINIPFDRAKAGGAGLRGPRLLCVHLTPGPLSLQQPAQPQRPSSPAVSPRRTSLGQPAPPPVRCWPLAPPV